MRIATTPDPLWLPIIAPVVWALHFMTCYVWAALACGRFAGSPDDLRAPILIATGVAGSLIAVCFAYGFHRHGRRWPDQPNDDGTPEDRTRFMAVTTMLLAALSLVGTVSVGLAALAMGGCR